MKKLWIAALLGLMLALSGCGGEKAEDAEEDAAVEEGQYKIEIFTAESTAVPVNTTEDPTVIQKLLESPEWERITDCLLYTSILCSAQGRPPYLVYTKRTEKRNVKNAKKMKKDVDIWQNIWYSNTRPKRPGQTSERNPRVSERNQKEI